MQGPEWKMPLPASSSWIMGGLWVLLTWMILGSPTLVLGYRRKGEVWVIPFPDYSSPLPTPPGPSPFPCPPKFTPLSQHVSCYLIPFSHFLLFVCFFTYYLCMSILPSLPWAWVLVFPEKTTGTHWCGSGYMLLNGHHLRTRPVLGQSITGISAPYTHWGCAITTPLLFISTTNALDYRLYQFLLPILVV